MKLSEMARKAKEKLSGAFGRNRKEESCPEMPEMDAQKAQEGQQDAKTGISSQNDEKGQKTANNEATAQFEAAILAGEEMKKAFREFELWRRYYREKAKMSNNERRRRGIPMVRRPKRQQYRVKKRKE